jgi:hypothetical protein
MEAGDILLLSSFVTCVIPSEYLKTRPFLECEGAEFELSDAGCFRPEIYYYLVPLSFDLWILSFEF